MMMSFCVDIPSLDGRAEFGLELVEEPEPEAQPQPLPSRQKSKPTSSQASRTRTRTRAAKQARTGKSLVFLYQVIGVLDLVSRDLYCFLCCICAYELL